MPIIKKNLVPKKTAKSILADKAKKTKKAAVKKKNARLPRAFVPETSGRPISADKNSTNKVVEVPELLKKVIRILVEKKAENPVLIHVGDLVGYTEFFLIGSGHSAPQVQAIAEAAGLEIKAAGRPTRIEGKQDAIWVLLDGGDFVVHLFQSAARKYYALEDLWGDARTIEIDEAEYLPAKRKPRKTKAAEDED